MFIVTWFKNSNWKQTKATTKYLTFTVSYIILFKKKKKDIHRKYKET